jgi:hypothetical protein
MPNPRDDGFGLGPSGAVHLFPLAFVFVSRRVRSQVTCIVVVRLGLGKNGRETRNSDLWYINCPPAPVIFYYR